MGDLLGGIRDILGDVAQYKLAENEAEWRRAQLAVGANGSLYVRGQAAGQAVAQTVTSLLPLLLLTGLGVLVYRLVR